MIRASSKVLSHLPPSSSILSRIFHSQFQPLHTKIIENESKLSKSKTLLFYKISKNKFCTFAEDIPAQISNLEKEHLKKVALADAFKAATTTEDMITCFKKLEEVFDESELGMACLKLGVRLDAEGEDPEKVKGFAVRALKVFDDGKPSYPLAMSLNLLGSSYLGSGKFNEALGVLNRANRVLSTCEPCEELGICKPLDALPLHHIVQNELSKVKLVLGRREEAIEHLKKCLEIKEKLFGENDKETGNSCRGLAEAHVELLNFEEALPMCLRALNIHTSQLGRNSVEVAHDRRLLGVIYTGLEKYEKALEENQLSSKVMKRWGLDAEVLRSEIDSANMNIALGRFDEAINSMKLVVQNTGEDCVDRALVLLTMGKALCSQEKFNEAKNCFKMACAILDKQHKTSPALVVECFMDISMQYEAMNEFETAISLLQTSKSILEKNPEEHYNMGGVMGRIGWLFMLIGKAKEAIVYLEEAVDRLRESFGAKHYGVAYVLNNLGNAYMELKRPQSAAQSFQMAKDIMDVSLGPYHTDTIETTEQLAKAYSSIGSYGIAMGIQEKVVEAWESHGSTAKDEVKEAKRILNEIRNKYRSLSDDSTTKALPPPSISRSSPAGLPTSSRP